jgi:hypothetical protein
MSFVPLLLAIILLAAMKAAAERKPKRVQLRLINGGKR